MTSLTLVRRIKAAPNAVFAAFVDPEKIALWWGPDAGPVLAAAVDPRLGGSFYIRFRMEDGSEHGSAGSFETFEPPHRLAFSWDGGKEGVARFELFDEGGRTRLVLTHEGISGPPAIANFGGGWHAHLAVLQAILAGGSVRDFWALHAESEAQVAAALG